MCAYSCYIGPPSLSFLVRYTIFHNFEQLLASAHVIAYYNHDFFPTFIGKIRVHVLEVRCWCSELWKIHIRCFSTANCTGLWYWLCLAWISYSILQLYLWKFVFDEMVIVCLYASEQLGTKPVCIMLFPTSIMWCLESWWCCIYLHVITVVQNMLHILFSYNDH